MRDENGIFYYDSIVITEGSVGFTPSPIEVIVKQVSDALAADKEKRVHVALIELGWTPPKTPLRT